MKPILTSGLNIFLVLPFISSPIVSYAGAAQEQIDSLQQEVINLKQQLDETRMELNEIKSGKSKSGASRQEIDHINSKDSSSNQSEILPVYRLKFRDGYKEGTVNLHTDESNPYAVDSENFMQWDRDDSVTFTPGLSNGK